MLSFSADIEKLPGNAKYDAETKIIKNPTEPFLGWLTLDLNLDLSITDKKIRFSVIQAVVIDNKGNIYAMDTKNCKIFKFDRNGRFLAKTGGKGQGPGEFESPSSLFIDENQNLYVSDGRKLSIFDKSLNFVKSLVLPHKIYAFFVDNENSIIAISHIIGEKRPVEAIVKYNSKGEKINEMVSFEAVLPSVAKREGKSFSLTVYHSYIYWPYLYPMPDRKKFVYGYPYEYKIIVMNCNKKIEQIIEKEEKPHKITHQEKDYIVKRIEDHLSRMGRKFPKKSLKKPVDFRLIDHFLIKFL